MNKSIPKKKGLSLPLFNVQEAREKLLVESQLLCLYIILGHKPDKSELHKYLPWPLFAPAILGLCQSTEKRATVEDIIRKLVNNLLILDSDDMLAYDTLSYMSMPGFNYFSILKFFHDHLTPQTYLEIGVNTGDSMVLCKKNTRAVGIDPDIDAKFLNDHPENARLYNMTSDYFFENIDLLSLFDEVRLDMAFIDGLHVFDFALRDFINVERYCHHNSIVLFHDTYPLERMSTCRKSIVPFYIGDVWKILPCLRKYRPDLKINTIPTRPSGLTVVRNLDPNSRILIDNLKEIYEEYMYLEFDYFKKYMAEGNIRFFPIDPNRIVHELLQPVRSNLP